MMGRHPAQSQASASLDSRGVLCIAREVYRPTGSHGVQMSLADYQEKSSIMPCLSQEAKLGKVSWKLACFFFFFWPMCYMNAISLSTHHGNRRAHTGAACPWGSASEQVLTLTKFAVHVAASRHYAT